MLVTTLAMTLAPPRMQGTFRIAYQVACAVVAASLLPGAWRLMDRADPGRSFEE